MPKKQLINCHAHVFTGNFVPPFLAKTIVPWPLYYLIYTPMVVGLVKLFFKIKHGIRYSDKIHKLWIVRFWKFLKKVFLRIKFWVLGHYLVRIPFRLVVFWISAIAVIYLVEFVALILKVDEFANKYFTLIQDWLQEHYLYFDLEDFYRIIWIVAVLLIIKSSRKPILFVLKGVFPAIKKVFSSSFLDLMQRYYLLGRFATTYKTQKGIAERAVHQLPKDSGMVILPMDMEFMKAGKTSASMRQREIAKKYQGQPIGQDLNDSYKYQMLELWDFVKDENGDGPKDRYHPFLFLDPRRIKEEGKKFFDWEWDTLEDENGQKIRRIKPKEGCFVHTYMEDCRFSGFKIYPALGYHCFDEYLLPIWRYAAENQIPIMAHCIMGTIYYRGTIKNDWHYHPAFLDYDGENPKVLPETKNVDFQWNFTHPLNYLCLLEPDLFKRTLEAVKENDKSRAQDAFLVAPDSKQKEFDYSLLQNLKICLAHYGGEEEWIRYMEQDRTAYSQRLMRDPLEGIKFMENANGDFSWYKLNEVWNDADWYSIISSLMIRYPNVYADLSYILSKESVYPLIKYTLEKNEELSQVCEKYLLERDIHERGTPLIGKNKLRSRVLFGTDFYVVRNHKSDKNLFVDLKTLLGDEDFDLIAKENPEHYLARSFK
ncbi:hypothetical protein [Flagellimonas algicola]|uniref:Amidohydrolase family protein n=1 Tax=Flagellimonas algicola TaxID=2583815 RepID=A0ABY2WS59_9FLAO|nr:hypothetical protein [Allomuricauda algicola]TMU57486.1 hypothetical protein FGG15_08060 [Allomuricauda algicola]